MIPADTLDIAAAEALCALYPAEVPSERDVDARQMVRRLSDGVAEVYRREHARREGEAMEKMSEIKVIKTFFQRADSIAPEGGREVKIPEMQELMKIPGAKTELAKLAAVELGVEIG